MSDLASMLKEFDDYIDAHEPNKAKADDKKQYVHEQATKLPEFFAKIIVKEAIKAARFRYE